MIVSGVKFQQNTNRSKGIRHAKNNPAKPNFGNTQPAKQIIESIKIKESAAEKGKGLLWIGAVIGVMGILIGLSTCGDLSQKSQNRRDFAAMIKDDPDAKGGCTGDKLELSTKKPTTIKCNDGRSVTYDPGSNKKTTIVPLPNVPGRDSVTIPQDMREVIGNAAQ